MKKEETGVKVQQEKKEKWGGVCGREKRKQEKELINERKKQWKIKTENTTMQFESINE